jgi:hypothetical protein
MTPRIHSREMATERSFSTPLLLGAAFLLAVLVFILMVVPLADCPRCSAWVAEAVSTSSASYFVCPTCQGKKRVSWLKRLRWRTQLERLR